MATTKLTLDGTGWVDLGSSGIVIDIDGAIKVRNDDSSPTDYEDEGIYVKSSIPVILPRPASGNLYAFGVGTLKYYEV